MVAAGSPLALGQVLPAAPDLSLSHVNQVWLMERCVAGPTGIRTMIAESEV